MVETFRKRNLKIGSTTGYTGEMMDLLLAEAAKRGYEPDSTVCATDVPAARPAPWMCLENAKRLGVYPMESVVKIGDTLPDVEEGLNAGMWTIGLAKTGNEIGLSEHEIKDLSQVDYDLRIARLPTAGSIWSALCRRQHHRRIALPRRHRVAAGPRRTTIGVNLS